MIITVLLVIITVLFVAPRINSVDLVNMNGNLSVSWSFLHTGGSGLESVTVQCSDAIDIAENTAASADPLATIIRCSTNEECEDGSVSIGPIAAGGNYSCTVNAENNLGSHDVRTNYVLATTGKAVVYDVVRSSLCVCV